MWERVRRRASACVCIRWRHGYSTGALSRALPWDAESVCVCVCVRECAGVCADYVSCLCACHRVHIEQVQRACLRYDPLNGRINANHPHLPC